VEPVKLRIERRGLILGGGALALLATGLARVDGAMAALGAAGLAALGIAALAARANLRGLAIELSGPHALAAGSTARFRITLRNPRRGLDAFGIHVGFPVPGDAECGTHALWVAAGSTAEADPRATPGRRGDHDLGDVVLRSGFPLGLFEAATRRACPHRLLVFPRPQVPVELLDRGAWRDDSPRLALAAGDAQGEPRGLRPYRAGDAARAICWPASLRSQARGGGLVVRELDPPGFHPREVAVVFHSYGSDRALIRPDRFERALSLAWGALRHFHDLGIPARLIADFDAWQPRPAAKRRQLARCGELLARAHRHAGTEAHELQAVLSSLEEGTGALVVSDMPPAALLSSGAPVWVDVARYESRAPFTRRPTARA
jgi:uncharacterized protein (DUF58 family)